MLGFHRSAASKEGAKSALKPALYEPPPLPAKAGAGPRPAPVAVPPREARANATPVDAAAPPIVAAGASEAASPVASDAPGSKLFIGVNIKLKGVEITDCDILVIEGHVEASVQSKLMQIAKPGTLKGTATIDVAEVNGEFTGELTARTRLVVHGTGRVTGTIRYGQLIVAEGGEVSGDVKPIEAAEKHAPHARAPATDARYVTPTHARSAGGD